MIASMRGYFFELFFTMNTLNLSHLSRNELEHVLNSLILDPAYGCLTRAGLDLYWQLSSHPCQAIFFDLDNLHALNSQYGYAYVDTLINNSLHLRSGNDGREADILTIARYMSGDEIVILIPLESDARAMIARLKISLAENGLSAMFAYGTVENDLHSVLSELTQNVMQQKNSR